MNNGLKQAIVEDCDFRSRTTSERLKREIAALESRLADLRTAEEALKANPEVARVIEAISRLGI